MTDSPIEQSDPLFGRRLFVGGALAVAAAAAITLGRPLPAFSAPAGFTQPFAAPMIPRGSVFGHSPEYGPEFHNGQDYSQGASGRQVHAIAAGTVVAARTGYDGGRGENVEISHGGGVVSRYYHFAAGSTAVAVGTSVTGGAVLGVVGTTGDSSGPHLHLEILQSGLRTDPWTFLLGAPTAGAPTPATNGDADMLMIVKGTSPNYRGALFGPGFWFDFATTGGGMANGLAAQITGGTAIGAALVTEAEWNAIKLAANAAVPVSL